MIIPRARQVQATILQPGLLTQGVQLSFKKYLGAMIAAVATVLLLSACSVSNKISKQANRILLKDTAISTGHIGISILDVASNQYWYNYDGDKYFVPASNTKLFSLYAGLKYLGDSLPGLRYELLNDTQLLIQPTGDPTFLHQGFARQPVYDFLKNYQHITFTNSNFNDQFLGRGWAWDDYTETYMTPRSNFPIYANLMHLKKTGDQLSIQPASMQFFIPPNTNLQNGFNVIKKWDDNLVTITSGYKREVSIPFTPHSKDILAMLQDTLRKPIIADTLNRKPLKNLVRSQPADSLFIPMMHRSDNFFAEQTLLMASNELLGYMDDRQMIDSILRTSLHDIPQLPKWVDGSGLSRYNLFTPQSFVYLLNKLKNEFGMERLKTILPTGGEGTLTAYYQKEAGYIFAKTGTLSNHCALSGFIITKQNKLLIFSILANHYQTSATPVRRAVEKFLRSIREKY